MAASRTGIRRRPRGTANTVGVMVHLDLDVKAVLDQMALSANVHQWEVVTAALKLLVTTTDANGVPAGLSQPDQPALVEDAREVRAA